MKVYDYCLFFEDGTKEAFYLAYGPEDRADSMITDYENSEYIRRFDSEAPGALDTIRRLDAERSLAFILVNPPRELSDGD